MTLVPTTVYAHGIEYDNDFIEKHQQEMLEKYPWMQPMHNMMNSGMMSMFPYMMGMHSTYDNLNNDIESAHASYPMR